MSKNVCAPRYAPPAPPTFPSNVDWKSIDHTLMYTLLSMPNQTEAADRAIESAWEYAASPQDFVSFFEERLEQCATLGLAAIAVTRELRTKYRIPIQQFGEWRTVERLSQAKEDLKKVRETRAERFATLARRGDDLSHTSR